jgi:hypothetical protein
MACCNSVSFIFKQERRLTLSGDSLFRCLVTMFPVHENTRSLSAEEVCTAKIRLATLLTLGYFA